MQLCSFFFYSEKKFGYTEKSGCSYSTNYMQLDFGLFGNIQRHIKKSHVVVQFDFSSQARAKRNRICTFEKGMQLCSFFFSSLAEKKIGYILSKSPCSCVVRICLFLPDLGTHSKKTCSCVVCLFFSGQGEKKSGIYLQKGHVVLQFCLSFGKKIWVHRKNRDVVSSQILVFSARSRGTFKKAMQLCSLTFLLWPGWKQNWICTEKSGCSYSNNYMQLDFGLFGLSQRHIQKCHVVAQFAFSSLARAEKKSDMY